MSPEEISGLRVAFVTNYGTILIRLRYDKAPEHVKRFVGYVAGKSYDATSFHRIYSDSVIFGGGPIEKEADEFLQDEIGLKHVRGAVSMSNHERKNTASREVFICLKAIPDFDKSYSVFGEVEEGLDVAEKISRMRTIENPSTKREDLPASPVKIVRALVLKPPVSRESGQSGAGEKADAQE